MVIGGIVAGGTGSRMAQQHGVCGTVLPATDTAVIRSAGGETIAEMPPLAGGGLYTHYYNL